MDEWARAQIEALEQRVAALERQLGGTNVPAPAAAPAPTSAPLPTPAPVEAIAQAEPDPELVKLVRQGKALEAIHTYVNKTGADLATAKAEVARIATSLRPEDFVS